MSTAIKKAATKKPAKKNDSDIISKLENALAELKEVLGEKKFSARIKKAAKIFLKGNKKTNAKKAGKKSTAKKSSTKKAAKPAAKTKKA